MIRSEHLHRDEPRISLSCPQKMKWARRSCAANPAASPPHKTTSTASAGRVRVPHICAEFADVGFHAPPNHTCRPEERIDEGPAFPRVALSESPGTRRAPGIAFTA